jgi:hypothetical protein
MDENNKQQKLNDKFPEANEMQLRGLLLKQGNIYYLPESFDKEAFYNRLKDYMETDLPLSTEWYLSDQMDFISYKIKKGMKSVLGLSYHMNLLMTINDNKLYYDFKPDAWFGNPEGKQSFSLKKLVNESKEAEIDSWIYSYLFNISLDGKDSFIDTQNIFIQDISSRQKLWLSTNSEEEEHLLAFLELSEVKKWTKEFEDDKKIRWKFLLTSKAAKIVGFNERDELSAYLDIKPDKLKVKKEIGRYPVIIGDIIFYTTRSNTGLFLEIQHAVKESAKERISETARLNWLNRDKKNGHETYALKLIKELVANEPNPFDDLSMLYMEYAEGKKDAAFSDFIEDEKLMTLLKEILNYAGTMELLTIWVEKWKIEYLDILALNKLLLEGISDNIQAKNILPFHKLVRSKYQKKNKDVINAVVFDYEYANHLIKCEEEEEAKKILNKRLKQLPDESISDLLPPKNLDLTGEAAGQILKVKILEVLASIEKEKSQTEIKKQLAVLQPLVPDRITDLKQSTEGALSIKASKIELVMKEGGLKALEDVPDDKKYNQLSEKVIEKNLRHPASRKDGSFANIQKWLAKVEVPDYSMIKSYSEQLSPKKHPWLHQIVIDIKYALGIENLEAYVSRGDKSVGINGFEGEPSFLIVGGDHLDKESPHYLGYKELKFSVAVEMAHLYFKHARITSTDVWRGAIDKGYWVLDTALAIIPIAGLFGKSLQGISKLNTISSILQKADKLDGISQNSKGIITATTQAVEVYNSKILKEKETSKEKQLMATAHVMQLSADRTALVFTEEINAAIRAMFLVSKRYYTELPVIEEYGLRDFLLKKDQEGNFIHQDFAIRLANLFAFYLSDEYDNVRNMLINSK